MSPRRLSRAEQREKTRHCLVEAAAKVFSRRGYDAASLDEVAEEAGFTKGAVYSNFKGKEDLFLATVEIRFRERLDDLRAVLGSEREPREKMRASGVHFMQAVNEDPGWHRLFFEFWAYAQRNPQIKRKFQPLIARFREELAALFEERHAHGMPLPIPAERLAAMMIAMATGIAIERQMDPRVVDEDLYATMMEIFWTGVGAYAPAPAPPLPSPPAKR